MDYNDTVRVLAKAAAYDRRTVGEADVAAWWEACGDLEAVDALEAVTLHYKDSSEWLMPSNLRYWARQAKLERQRQARTGQSPALELPSRFEPMAGDAARAAFERSTAARNWAREKVRAAQDKFHDAHDAHNVAIAALERLDEVLSELAAEQQPEPASPVRP